MDAKEQPVNSKNWIIVIAICSVIVVVSLYWFSVRPYFARKNCTNVAFGIARAEGGEDYSNSEILSANNVVTQEYNQAYIDCLSGQN